MHFSPFEIHRSVLPWKLNELGLTSCGVEVGVAQGLFSEHILKNWPGVLKLVDPYEGLPGYDEHYDHKENLRQMFKRLEPYQGRWAWLGLPSLEAAKHFADASHDFVYLDANHSYEAVAADLEAWWPKIRPGGLFAGDDYGCFDETPVDFGHGQVKFGVKKAVDEWALKEKINISINWLADWQCAGYIETVEGRQRFEVQARNWWCIK